MIIKKALEKAQKKLSKASEKPINESQILLSYLLQKDKIYLFANDDLELEKNILDKFFEFIKRRENYEPIEYIINRVSFYSNEFFVDNRVLIPRPETELLIDEVLKLKDITKVVEIGVGSGIISIMLKKLKENFEITAGDVSKKAIEVAKINAKKHNVDIKFIHSNLLDNIDKKFDLIISNPPYISNKFKLEKNLDYEPQNALFGGVNGDEILRDIIDLAVNREIKYLICEMGYDQKDKILEYIKKYTIKNIKFYKDLARFDRGFIIKF